MSGEHGVRTIFRVAADLNFAAKTLVLKISKGGEATYKVVYNESVGFLILDIFAQIERECSL